MRYYGKGHPFQSALYKYADAYKYSVFYRLCHYRICLEPASVSPHEWPDDITKWPVSTGKPSLVFRHKMLTLSKTLKKIFFLGFRFVPGTTQGTTPTCLT